MPDACLNVPTNPPLHRGRQLAWQIALLFPPVAIASAVLLLDAPPPYLWQTVSGTLLLALVVSAAITDILWHRIPNWATYSAFGWAILINGLAAVTSERTAGILGAVGIADCLAGAILPFCFMLLIFSLTGGGAGDVKLTAAMGALLGLDRTIDVILLSFIFAGGFAFIRAIWQQGPWNLAVIAWRGIGHWIMPLWILPLSDEQRTFLRQPMPLGPSFALGAILVLFDLNVQQLAELASSLWGGT